jgi:hypothetical protein
MATPEPTTMREAVARFDDPERLETAISALQSHGFDRADISFIARDGFLGEHVASGSAGVRQSAEDATLKREAPVESTDLRQGRMLGTSMAAVVAAFAAAGFTIATGGAAALAMGLAAAAGLGVGAAGATLGMKADQSQHNFLDEQLARGGVLVWVRTRDAAAEGRALAILRAEGGTEVHLHDLPQTA